MGQVILYNAISIDGFIAGEHDETPWSKEEWAAFQEFVKSCDVCLLGRRTYEIMRDSGEFIDGPRYIVVTSNSAADTGRYPKLSINSIADIPNGKVGLIGGAELNGSLGGLGAISEIVLDVEPIVLGSGKRLFGSHNVHLPLSLQASKRIGSSTVQNHYKVEE